MCELTPRQAIIWGLQDFLGLWKDWPDGDLRRHLRNGFPWILRDWFPDDWLTPAFRRGLSRALEELEDEGILIRIASGTGRKTTHIFPSVLFVSACIEEGTAEDIAKYRRTLGVTGWGQEILHELEEGEE